MDSNGSSSHHGGAGTHKPHRRALRSATAPDGKGKRSAGAAPPPSASSGHQQAAVVLLPAAACGEGASAPPCGACKFLRRKCVAGGCVFAPYFRTEQGPAKFAVVHKIFGASNVSKMLGKVPAGRRHEAVATICYEAQARLADPVYGCVSTILALQQQVASMQADLSIVQSQLLNKQMAAIAAVAAAGGGVGGFNHEQQQPVTVVKQGTNSGNSSASDLVNNATEILSGLHH